MKGSLKEVQNYAFHQRLARNSCAVGRFEPDSPRRIVAGTLSSKIVIQNTESVFHINEPITAVAVLEAEAGNCDRIVVGTEKSLLMFDVYNNKTIFRKEMPEGINVILTGKVDEHKEKLVICGCGSTIWGINERGEDVYWTTLGDEVKALILCDVDGDGQNELVAGTSGTEIKVLKNTSLHRELVEGDPTVALCSVGSGSFAFGLTNGVIGIYRRWERVWRVKTKHQICALVLYPLNSLPNGVVEPIALTCVWRNGKIDVRNIENGENYRKSQLDGGEVVDVFVADLHDTSQKQLFLAFQNGKIRIVSHLPDDAEADDGLRVLREFGQRKHNLMEELKNFEMVERHSVEAAIAAKENSTVESVAIPADTQLSCRVELNIERGLLLNLSVTNNVPIRAVLMFAEGIFPSECYAIHPKTESPTMTTAIRPVKNAAADILIRVFVGSSGGSLLRVLECDQPMPRFATHSLCESEAEQPDGFVDVDIQPRAETMSRWFERNFLLKEETVQKLVASHHWVVSLRCCYSKEVLQLEATEDNRLIIRHNRIQTAGEVLQSLVAAFEVKSLRFRANFPAYQTELQTLLSSMADLHSMNDKLTTEWTERLNAIRETVVRAEDALATRQFAKARKLYVRIALLNRECVAQRVILSNSRDNLVNALKTLNQMIKYNAQLRVGEDANDLVKECRRLVGNENFGALSKRLLFSA